MPPGHYENRIPVRNSDPVSTSMRDVSEHTTRIVQKNTLLLYGGNKVPDRQFTGPQREIDF